jgi:hypothetical protein
LQNTGDGAVEGFGHWAFEAFGEREQRFGLSAD